MSQNRIAGPAGVVAFDAGTGRKKQERPRPGLQLPRTEDGAQILPIAVDFHRHFAGAGKEIAQLGPVFAGHADGADLRQNETAGGGDLAGLCQGLRQQDRIFALSQGLHPGTRQIMGGQGGLGQLPGLVAFLPLQEGEDECTPGRALMGAVFEGLAGQALAQAQVAGVEREA